MRRTVKRNPLKNPLVMRKLNPYAAVLKKYSRITNEQRRGARELLKKRRGGEKVDAKALQKAALTLGVKLRKYKEFKNEIQKKKATLKANREKVAENRAKKAAKSKK